MTKEEEYIAYRQKVVARNIANFNYKHNMNLEFPSEPTAFFNSLCTSNVCATCKSRCCYSFPCKFSPHDFLDITDIDYMSSILDLGVLCIAESIHDKLLIVRPRGYHDSKRIVSKTFKYSIFRYNPCVLQSSTGCMLSAFYRPTEGLLYLPLSEHNHMIAYTERDLEKDYAPYQDSLIALYEKYYNKTIPIKKPSSALVRKLTRMMAGYKH